MNKERFVAANGLALATHTLVSLVILFIFDGPLMYK